VSDARHIASSVFVTDMTAFMAFVTGAQGDGRP
jgi:hypothetical protein